jgi:uncharacterized membrane protein/protein-disulfide isomerase
MRWTATAGLLISAGLAAVSVASILADRLARVPYCSWASWLDCAAVLSHPRWSRWLGVPVAAPATLLYLWALLLLIRPNLAANGRVWSRLRIIGTALPAAAGWFVWLQAGVIGKACVYCLIDHAVGAALGAMIWLAGPRDVGGRGAPAAGGLAVVGVLIAGQWLHEPDYARPIVLGTTIGNTYTESRSDGRLLRLAGGAVVLDPESHLALGRTGARRWLVESIDYTCPRCHMLWRMLKPALPLLGEDYGVIVLTFPINHRCNRFYLETEPRHEQACELARIAQAVWAADRRQYHGFHDWLFEHQDKIDPASARIEAERRVGTEALRRATGLPEIEALIRRDVEISGMLGVRQLPGLFGSEQAIVVFPDEPERLAELLRAAAARIAD